MNYLREQFQFYLKLAKPLILNMPKSKDRIVAAAWLKKIMDNDAGSEDLRTVYLKLLLFTLQRRKLTGLFADDPTKYDTLEELPPTLNLNELARNVLEQEQAEIEHRVFGELLGDMDVYPPYTTDCSSDLTEYVVAQDIPNFGVHAYYAFSEEPIDKWLKAEMAILPKGVRSVIKSKQTTGSSKSVPSCVCTPKSARQTVDGATKDDSDEPECRRKPESSAERRKRRPTKLGRSPPIHPIGEVQNTIDEREVPTWGTNLLEVREKVDIGKISKPSEEEKQLEKDALEFLKKAHKDDDQGLADKTEDMLRMINEYKAGKFDKLRKPTNRHRKEVQFAQSSIKQEEHESEQYDDIESRNIGEEADAMMSMDYENMDFDAILHSAEEDLIADRSAFNLGVDDDQMVVNLYDEMHQEFEDVFNVSQTAGDIASTSPAFSHGIPVTSAMPSPIPKRHPSPERFIVDDARDEMIFNRSRSSPLSPLMLEELAEDLPPQPVDDQFTFSRNEPHLANVHALAQSVIEEEQQETEAARKTTAPSGTAAAGSSSQPGATTSVGKTCAPCSAAPRNEDDSFKLYERFFDVQNSSHRCPASSGAFSNQEAQLQRQKILEKAEQQYLLLDQATPPTQSQLAGRRPFMQYQAEDIPGVAMAPQDPTTNTGMNLSDSCPVCGSPIESDYDHPFLDEITPPFGIFEGDLDASGSPFWGENAERITDITPPREFFDVEPMPRQPSPQRPTTAQAAAQSILSGGPPCARPGIPVSRIPGASRIRPPSQLRPPGQIRFPGQIRPPSQLRAPGQFRGPRQIRPPSQIRGASLIRPPTPTGLQRPTGQGIPVRQGRGGPPAQAQSVCDPCDPGSRPSSREAATIRGPARGRSPAAARPAAQSRLPVRPGQASALPRPGGRQTCAAARAARAAPPAGRQRGPLYFPPSRDETGWGSPPTAKELRRHQIPGEFFEERPSCRLYIPERQTHVGVPRKSSTRINLMQKIAEAAEEGTCAPCGSSGMAVSGGSYPDDFEEMERRFRSPPRPVQTPQSPESPDFLADVSRSMAKTLMEKSKRDVQMKAVHQEMQIQGPPRRNVRYPAQGITYSPKRPEEQFGQHPWGEFEQRLARLRQQESAPPPCGIRSRSPGDVPDVFDLPLEEMYGNIHDISPPVFADMPEEDRLPEGIYSPPLIPREVRRDIRLSARPQFDPRQRRDLRREDRRAMRGPTTSIYNIPEGGAGMPDGGLYAETPKTSRQREAAEEAEFMKQILHVRGTTPTRTRSPCPASPTSYIGDESLPEDMFYSPPPRSASPDYSPADMRAIADESMPSGLMETSGFSGDDSAPFGSMDTSGGYMLDTETFPNISGASMLEDDDNGCTCGGDPSQQQSWQ